MHTVSLPSLSYMVAKAVAVSSSISPIVTYSSGMLNVRLNTSAYSNTLSSIILILDDATNSLALNVTFVVFGKVFEPLERTSNNGLLLVKASYFQ